MAIPSKRRDPRAHADKGAKTITEAIRDAEERPAEERLEEEAPEEKGKPEAVNLERDEPVSTAARRTDSF